MREPRTGARILAEQLLIQGVNHVFCVPGAGLAPALDALADLAAPRVIVNGHESASSFMAGAYARLTGQPGVAFVSGGPGACNAAIGIHHARQDSLPLVLFVSQAPSSFLERAALQEIDCRALFGALAKWVVQVEHPQRIPEFVARAFQTAASGRPGPVVLALPEDVLRASAAVADGRCHVAVQAAPSDTQIAALRRQLGRAQRPLVIAGGWGWSAAASANLQLFVEVNALPLTGTIGHQDIIDNHHPNYVGDVGLGMNPMLARRLEAADLILALGPRLDQATIGGYERLQPPVPQQALVHAHSGIEELGRVYQADLLINTGMPQLAARLAMLTPIDAPPWAAELAVARAQYLAWRDAKPATAAARDGPPTEGSDWLDHAQLMAELRAALPRDAIVVSGSGNFLASVQRHFPYYGSGTQLALMGGSKGYGLAAAIAAKIAAPERTVVCLSGESDFLSGAPELATACQNSAAVLFVVFRDQPHTTGLSRQEPGYPGKAHATTWSAPACARLSEAYGAYSCRVSHSVQWAPTLAAALAQLRSRRLPALIELAEDAAEPTPAPRLTAPPPAR